MSFIEAHAEWRPPRQERPCERLVDDHGLGGAAIVNVFRRVQQRRREPEVVAVQEPALEQPGANRLEEPGRRAV